MELISLFDNQKTTVSWEGAVRNSPVLRSIGKSGVIVASSKQTLVYLQMYFEIYNTHQNINVYNLCIPFSYNDNVLWRSILASNLYEEVYQVADCLHIYGLRDLVTIGMLKYKKQRHDEYLEYKQTCYFQSSYFKPVLPIIDENSKTAKPSTLILLKSYNNNNKKHSRSTTIANILPNKRARV